jgi:restriction endonuclease S subunit
MNNKQLAELGEEVGGESGLPKGWCSVALGQAVAFKTGPFGSALHKSDYIFDGVPLINPTHIKDGRLVPSKDVTVSDGVSDRLKDYALLSGDVVMGRRGEMGRCAEVTEAEQGWLCGTGSVIVRTNGAVNSKYLQRFLSSPSVVSTLNGDSVGSTMVNLNQSVLLGLNIELAPLPEQKRIADKLDATLARVDVCRERLARVTPLLKRFRQSVLAAATSGQLTADWREQQNGFAAACKADYASSAAAGQESVGASSPCSTGPTAITADLPSSITDESGSLQNGDCANKETPTSAALDERLASQAHAQAQAQAQANLWAVGNKALIELNTSDLIQASKRKWLLQNSSHNEAGRVEKRLSKFKHHIKANVGLPTSWVWSAFEDAVLLIVDCHNKTAPYETEGIPLVRTTNIRDGRFIWEELRYVNQETYQFWSKRCIPEAGDLVFTREAPMGEVAIIPEGTQICLGQRTMLIRPIEAICSAKYIQAVIMDPNFKARSDSIAVGTGVKHYRVGDVSELLIPLPPVDEQTEIVRRVETLFAFADRLEARLASANAATNRLTPSLLAKAFRGELVQQYPKDEPASELLKRLAAQREVLAKAPKAKRTTKTVA